MSVKFHNREAALTAMILIDVLAQQRITRNVHPQPNGDILFRRLGAWFRLTPTSCDMLPEVVTVTPKEQAQIALSGMNQLMVGALDRYNPQHDAYNDNRRGRAYETDKPCVEGYDRPWTQTHDRGAAQARVQGERGGVLDDRARSLVQARLNYRQGR